MYVFVVDVERQMYYFDDVELGCDHDWKELICCEKANITQHKIGSKIYNVICDADGFKRDRRIAAVSSDCKHRLMVGNLVVCNTNEMGNCEGLWSREDEDNMVKASVAVKCNDGNFYHVLKLDE